MPGLGPIGGAPIGGIVEAAAGEASIHCYGELKSGRGSTAGAVAMVVGVSAPLQASAGLVRAAALTSVPRRTIIAVFY